MRWTAFFLALASIGVSMWALLTEHQAVFVVAQAALFLCAGVLLIWPQRRAGKSDSPAV